MRQHEDGDFYSLLNRVRYGIITQSDDQLFKKKKTFAEQPKRCHAYHPTRKKVNKHNMKRLSELTETVIDINAFHYYSQEDQSQLAENFINSHNILTGGLQMVLKVCKETVVTTVDIGPISPV